MDFNIEIFDIKYMDIEQVRTFLAVSAHGTFLEAARRLHVTQSTVSARIRNLEEFLGTALFTRNRKGAMLTLAGKRFIQHAKSLLLTLEQAKYEIGLPSRFRASIKVGARIALWEGFLPRWIGEIRRSEPDISITSEIGFEDDLMRRLIEGTLDIGLMYTPQHSPGLVVEQLFEETLVLVTTSVQKQWPDEDYIYVDWGPAFYEQHSISYPDLERPAQVVNIGWLGIQLILHNGGSCFVPVRMARELLQAESLFIIPGSPEFQLPVYMVYARDHDVIYMENFLTSIREHAATEHSAMLESAK